MIAQPQSVPYALDHRPGQRVSVQVQLTATRSIAETLAMPFGPGRHPDTIAIGSATRAWLRRLGLIDDRNAAVFERGRFEELAGRVCHPFGATTVRLTCDFISALFVLDDWLDATDAAATRNEVLAARAVEVFRRAAHTGVTPTAGHPLGPVAAALADVTARLRATGATLDAYLAELDVYFDGVIAETRRRVAGYASLTDYADARVAFSAVYACIELGLAQRGRPLDPALRPLARAANLSVSYVNDVYSWPKERALDERSNLVHVLLPGHVDEAAAFRAACRVTDDVTAELEALAPAAARIDPDGAALCVNWARGNYDWHAEATHRYTEALSVAPRAA